MNCMFKYLLLALFRSTRTFFSVARKVATVLIVFGAVISLFIYFIQKDKVYTQNDIVERNRVKIYSQLEELEKNPTQENKLSASLYRAWNCNMIGEACTDNPEDGDRNYSSSLFGKASGLISIPYSHPPASGIAWVQQGLQNAGFVPNTYAATGTGFAQIHSYLPIWKLFRDISYLLLVLVMISIGFMIMFRVNLGGAAVGIESALPRIVLAMIMITFSFPIAGFLIDMMYALIAVCIGLLYNAGLSASDDGGLLVKALGTYPTAKDYLNNYLTAGFLELWPSGSGNFMKVGASLWQLMPPMVQGMFQIIIVPIATYYTSTILHIPEKIAGSFGGISIAGFAIGDLVKLPVVVMATALIGFFFIIGPSLVLGIIIMLTILIFIFRIFFMLLESYIKILLYIIFSPFILMFSAIPGNGNIGWWLRNMIGELMTFPTVMIITLVGNAIMAINVRDLDTPLMHLITLGQGPGSFESTFRLPFLYGFQTDDFNTIIALGLVLMIPDFVKIVKNWIGVQDSPLKFGLGTYFAGASLFTGAFGLGANLQGWKQSAVGYDPNKGWMDSLPGFEKMAERIRNMGK